MANAMYSLYEESKFEVQARTVMYEIGKTQAQVDRLTKLKANLEKVAAHVLKRIKDLTELLAAREEARVKFDHYRNKVDKMNKEEMGADPDETKQERFARNQGKFDEARKEFDDLSRQTNESLDKVEGKVEQVVVDLTLKFTKEAQFKLVQEMNAAFKQLENVQG